MVYGLRFRGTVIRNAQYAKVKDPFTLCVCVSVKKLMEIKWSGERFWKQRSNAIPEIIPFYYYLEKKHTKDIKATCQKDRSWSVPRRYPFLGWSPRCKYPPRNSLRHHWVSDARFFLSERNSSRTSETSFATRILSSSQWVAPIVPLSHVG